jgi:glycine cleavage system protein P-like pyridoxal-binding family
MSKTIFEHSSPSRKGVTLPKREIDTPLPTLIPETMLRTKKVRFREVSELDVMRHISLFRIKTTYRKGIIP